MSCTREGFVSALNNLYKGLFADLIYRYPDLKSEFERDLCRLQATVGNRGIYTFVVDLPRLCKHLDRCLDEGKYVPSNLPLSRQVSATVVIPQFMRGLYLLIFSPDGCLKDDCDSEAVFFLRQVYNLAKKADLQCSERAEQREVESFLMVDEELPMPEHFWIEDFPSDDQVIKQVGSFANDVELLDRKPDMFTPKEWSTLLSKLDDVSGLVCCLLGSYDRAEWRHRHGPGAIAQCVGPVNKYLFTNWPDRLESEFPLADCGFHSYASWARRQLEEIGSERISSRLISVKKSYLKPRLIAAEPMESQWCQQNLRDYFYSRVAQSTLSEFLRFRDQSLNQQLCLEGSKDGSLVTIDLSAASDRVTCANVGHLFRHNIRLLQALRASRTSSIAIPKKGADGSVVELRKFSTMGSAVTFPVESLLFLTIALATLAYRGKERVCEEWLRRQTGKVAVFGDDIVVPKIIWEEITRVLEGLHFKVNSEKSYSGINFRESCGVEAFRGSVVTSAYWKSPCDPRNAESWSRTVDVANNLYRKFLLSTSAVLESSLAGPFKPALVDHDSDVVGLTSFCRAPERHRKRWNKNLQVEEVLIPGTHSTSKKHRVNDESALLQFFTEEPSPLLRWESGFVHRPKSTLRLSWVTSWRLHPSST